MSTAIEIQNLSYRYADGQEALRNVSFTVREGERVALIGPNGAGKSTLLQHLNGLLPARLRHDGAVHVFGEALTRASLPEVRRRVGFIFQDPNDQLFCPTVFEDVSFGPQQIGLEGEPLRDKVAAALMAVGLSGFESRSTHHLSGGEKRRVCLAGVMACDPRLLVLDEPTSDLDPRGRRELKSQLMNLPVTQIIATHDLEMVVEICTSAILLDGGEVIAQGAPRDLLRNQELMLKHGLECPHILQHQHPHTLDLKR